VDRRAFLAAVATVAAGSLAASARNLVGGEIAKTARKSAPSGGRKGPDVIEKIHKTDEEWKKILTPQQYDVLRKKGTERAWSGEYVNNHEKGIYNCAGCDLSLFSSDTKFESGTGWPSFYEPIAPDHIGTETDRSFFMSRTEVHCARCEGHLGHVFDDGPRPTGLRYCMNSVALKFVKA
jgi:peptide-methionine (R)-S-oxide reductase